LRHVLPQAGESGEANGSPSTDSIHPRSECTSNRLNLWGKKCQVSRNLRTDVIDQRVQTDRVTKTQNRKKKDGRETRLQNILVPIDFSMAAKKAFQYALDVAGRYRSKIILLHVVTLSESEKADRAISAAKRNLATFCKTEGASSKRCKSIVRTGIPFFEITQSANGSGADLIILGRRDSTFVGRFGEGHTSDRVVRYATCPVLLVRETGRHFVAMPDGA
jgi:nucleotide-binding universal stress UspA family protein